METSNNDNDDHRERGKIDNENSRVLSEIRLPSAEHRLFCWKIRQGAVVRKGETIALVVLKSATSSAASTADGGTTATPSSSGLAAPAKFKRPTKRRRPGSAAAAAAAAAPTTAAVNSTTTSEASTAASTATTATKPAAATTNTLLRNLIKLPVSSSKQQQAASNDDQIMMDAFPDTDNKPPITSTTASSKTTATATSSLSTSQKIPVVAEADGIIQFGKPAQASDALVIGAILQCEHPTVVSGMCAVCGQSVLSTTTTASSNDDDTKSSFAGAFGNGLKKDHATNDGTTSQQQSSSSAAGGGLTRVTVSGGVTMSISASEGQRMAQQDAVRLRKQSKLSLVLDLDHTLIHATNDIRARQQLGRPDVRTLILPVQLEGEGSGTQVWMQHFVKLRPHLKEFLEMASTMYEIGVYTAGTRQYAEQVTLLLARHMVDSQMDQTDLDHLRHQIAHAEHSLAKQRQEAAAQPPVEEEDEGDEKKSSGTTGQATGGDSSEEHATKKSSSTAGQKRKRVTFGNSSEKSDAVKPDELAKLKSELEKAERMEQKAWECRQRLFGTRIVSRTDVGDLGVNVKSLRRIYPCGGAMAVVVDDREDVWANAEDNEIPGEPPHNLLLVRPYHWGPFAGFADVNNTSGEDFGADNMRSDEKEDDQQLLWTADVLRRIHETYYENVDSSVNVPSRTVPEIVRDLRKKILKNTGIVLSSLVPLHRQQASQHPRHQFVRHTETLGARLLSTISPQVTHVVAARDGTDKILAARQMPGCHIVKPSWLMECVWTFTRRDVRPHLWPVLKRSASSLSRPARGELKKGDGGEEGENLGKEASVAFETNEDTSNENVGSDGGDDDDDEDDDDDLVAELENELKQGG